jgi:hypothetical protein
MATSQVHFVRLLIEVVVNIKVFDFVLTAHTTPHTTHHTTHHTSHTTHHTPHTTHHTHTHHTQEESTAIMIDHTPHSKHTKKTLSQVFFAFAEGRRCLFANLRLWGRHGIETKEFVSSKKHKFLLRNFFSFQIIDGVSFCALFRFARMLEGRRRSISIILFFI